MESGKIRKYFTMAAWLLPILSTLLGGTVLSAQTAVPLQKGRITMDTDFMSMRFCDASSFNYSYDDYIQYSPAVAVLGLKAFGVDGMTKFGRFAVSSAFSTVIMAGVVNGLKYTVHRERPNMADDRSFPSGHTATAFMSATILQKEYGWKYPWVGFLGYSVAAVTGASRILNNAHWMSDVVTGAAIGIGSVHLGYYLTGLIFKEKGLKEGWHKHLVFFEPEHLYWGASLNCGRRFILGRKALTDESVLPFRGSVASAEFEFPIMQYTGALASVGCSSLSFRNDTSMNAYNALAGLYWSLPFAKIFEIQAKGALGYAWHAIGNGIDFMAGLSLNLMTGTNYKIKAFAEYETFSFSGQKPFINSFILGWSTGFCW